MNTTPPNVSSYRDRHGKQRWRFRRGTFTVCLPGRPGDPNFEIARLEAIAGKRKPDRKTEIRRAVMLDHYAENALMRAKDRAKRKGLSFALDRQDYETLMRDQNWQCAVSGIRFKLSNAASAEDIPFRPSLDQINAGQGYVTGNVRIVCEIVNLAMNKWGSSALLRLVEAMANQVANPTGEPSHTSR